MIQTTGQPGSALNKLMGALLAELANEVPDGVQMEGIRADLLAASRSYELGRQEELALRFYLAFRSMLHEYDQIQRTSPVQGQVTAPLPGGGSYASPISTEPAPYSTNLS